MSPSRLRFRRSRVESALLAVAGGWAWGACFGVETSWWLPWIALVPLMLILPRPGSFWWGWLHGIVFWLVSMSWIAATVETFGGLPAAVAMIVQVLLALYLGLGHGIFAYLGAKVWRRGGRAVYWALPALWLVVEWERAFAVGRFPWNLAAYAWTDLPGTLEVSAWVGALGAGTLLLFANVTLARAWTERRWLLAPVAFLLPLTVLVLAVRFAPPIERSGEGRQVLVVQPNAPIVSDETEIRANYRRLIEMSLEECRRVEQTGGEALLIWPESAGWPWSFDTAPHLRQDVYRLNDLGCEVFLGSMTTEGTRYFNSAMLISGFERRGLYSKRKLVPWGEYVPLSEVFPFIGTLARQAGNFSRGETLGLIPWQDEQLGTAICYEVIFAGAAAEQVRAGATVLVTITNDAWYGDTAAPWQHLRAARFRAAEARRPMLRAALTGVSALIDGRGRVASQLGVGERGVLRGRIAGSRELTFHSRAPWFIPLLSFLAAAFAIVRAWR